MEVEPISVQSANLKPIQIHLFIREGEKWKESARVPLLSAMTLYTGNLKFCSFMFEAEYMLKILSSKSWVFEVPWY